MNSGQITLEERNRFRNALLKMPSSVRSPGTSGEWAVLEVSKSEWGCEIRVKAVFHTEEEAERSVRDTIAVQTSIAERFKGKPLPPIEQLGRKMRTYWFEKYKTIHSFDAFKVKVGL